MHEERIISSPAIPNYMPLDSLRLKATDRCPWNCWWCHNEGTGTRNPKLIGDVQWTDEFAEIIGKLRRVIPLREVHLTGGEPTSNPFLADLVSGLTSVGLNVKATTIGCAPTTLSLLFAAGLRSFNFSLHAVTPDLLYTTQANRSLDWVGRQLEQELKAIELAKTLGAKVKVNVVVSGESDYPRVREVINWAVANCIPIRLLNELASGEKAVDAIYELLHTLDAEEMRSLHIRGSSSYTRFYALPSGYEIGFKQIENLYLTSMCTKCPLKGHGCYETFYGIRVERRFLGKAWQYFIRLCIHRDAPQTLMSVDQFLQSRQADEIAELVAGRPRGESYG